MGPAWTCIHFSCCNGSVFATFLHLLLYWVVGIDVMLGKTLNVYSMGFILSDFVSLLWTFTNRYEQILHFLIINFQHGDINFVLFVFVFISWNSFEYFLAWDGNDALALNLCTLLAPYPTIEYDFPAPVWP